MTPPPSPGAPIARWRIWTALGGSAVILAIYVVFGAVRVDVPVRRALGKTLGAETGKIEISDVAAFTDVDGSSYRIDIVCGWAGKSRRRAFAAIVQHSGGRHRYRTNDWNRAYWLKELVIQPPPGRPWLDREKVLLDTCFGPLRR